MPKHAVNTSEQNRIRKLFLAGNSVEAIAAHMNVASSVVEAWHPDAVAKRKEEIRLAEIDAGARAVKKETKTAEDAAAAAKRSEAGKRAAATRAANQKAARDQARDKDRAVAEAREKAQADSARMAAVEE
jgi:hypothetical protein